MTAFAPIAGPRPWRPRSLRAQVMGAVVAINLCAALVALVVIIANARRATEVEMLASIAVAERFVQETVERLVSEQAGAPLTRLPLHIRDLRHVDIRIEDAAGGDIDVSPGENADEAHSDVGIPPWFTALVSVPSPERIVPIVENGRTLGRVHVTGQASDEIAEVWEDMSALALLAGAVNIAILVALYLVLGRLLRPLDTLSKGLQQLEEGRFDHRVPAPPVRELGHLADRFNALGAALRLARDDNRRLNERLIQVQDSERRQIASDLHDELGPCLFGLRANLDSVERLSARADAPIAASLAERLTTMVEILDRIQGLNRRMLRKLRPMVLGHLPLAAVITDLVADFESHSPDRDVRLTTHGLAEHYGESIDITLFRCVQEAVTNALRHGDARAISVHLRHDHETDMLELAVEDDGAGMPPEAIPGLGLTGIEERVGALGGEWRIGAAEPRGTRIDIRIPLPAANPASAERMVMT
ncbi:ATP-binding protein [Terrihabitans sp. B22-R8]|uniref:ATP-binding protein n=1 Tax=Terrihabitans sp. B22-R8 TaxID=3425128 RepID=UPI00403CF53C